MLCSICKKNTAVIFVNKRGEDGKAEVEGLCYDCAKKKGINPIDAMAKQANLSDKDIQDLSSKLDKMFQNLSVNLNDIDEEQLANMMNGEMENGGEELDENGEPQGMPLGSIFSGIFGITPSNEQEQNSNYSSNSTQKVKERTKQNKKRKALDTFGTNLTNKARNGQIDRVIGRDKEIQRMIQILNRRSKNNPCLIGEPGVGKTAIVEKFVWQVVTGNCHQKFRNSKIISLDVTSILAGTQYRGSAEDRFKGLIDFFGIQSGMYFVYRRNTYNTRCWRL